MYRRSTTRLSDVILKGEIISSHCSLELVQFSGDLNIMSGSQIFLDIWNQIMSDTLRRAKENNECVKLDDVVTCVWNPAIDFCTQLLIDLHSNKIKLSIIDGHIKMLNSIEEQLQIFSSALKFVLKDEKVLSFYEDNSWLKDRIATIKQYCNFKRYSNDASIFLTLKEVLNIDGDFGVIQEIASNVSL